MHDVATLEARNLLAEAITFHGDLAGAEALLRSAHADASASTDDIGTWPLTIDAQLGEVLQKLGRHAEGEPYPVELSALSERVFPEGHWQVAVVQFSPGNCIDRQGRRQEAQP